MHLAALLVACAAPHHVDYEAHRGGRALRPENTLDSFAHALELDVDTLEMDIGMTADGVLVVHHDERLNPDITRDASGDWIGVSPALHSLRLAELETYDVGRIKPGTAYAARFPGQHGRDGARIPTLDQVIALAEKGPRRIRYNLEIKTTPTEPDDTAPPELVADRLVATVRAHGISARTTIQSFDFRGLREVARIAPDLPRSCLTEAKTTRPGSSWTAGLPVGDSVPELVARFGCQIWSPDATGLTREQIAEAHRLGLRVLPWTVNDRDQMVRLIEWGVDGLITDAPDLLPRR